MVKKTFIEKFAETLLFELNRSDFELYYYVFEDGKFYALPANSDVERVRNASQFLGAVPLSFKYWRRELPEIEYYVNKRIFDNVVDTVYADVVIAPLLEKKFKFLGKVKRK